MLPPCCLASRTGFTSRSGLTRTELLVGLSLVFLVTILTSVGPIRHYLKQARINRAVENARTLNTLLTQYATDNNDTYPVGQGTTAEGKSGGALRAICLMVNMHRILRFLP